VRVPRVAAAFCVVAALAAPAFAVSAPESAPRSASEDGVAAADYDLGVRKLPQPGQKGPFATMPIRIWGTIAGPTTAGPHPVVLVAHGAHGDNCPGEFGTWPCFAREQRNDLGLRYLVRSLAAAGFVAVAPDLNAAYSGGWGEGRNREPRRFRQVVDTTLEALAAAGRGEPTRLGIPLAGQVDLGTVGVIGHSRGGMNALRWAKGRATVRSMLLLAPFYDPTVGYADVPTTLVLGTCDGDTRLSGAGYFSAATRSGGRTGPAWRLQVTGPNHNYYNRTLVALRNDDAAPTSAARPGSCTKQRRPAAGTQQAWLASVVRDHFTNTLLGAPAASWQQAGAPAAQTLYGLAVRTAAYRPPARLGP